MLNSVEMSRLLLSTAGDECPSGYGLCGPSAQRRCIPETWFCDGDNDCGDRSDEDREQCGEYCAIISRNITQRHSALFTVCLSVSPVTAANFPIQSHDIQNIDL